MLCCKGFPRIADRLLEAKRNATLFGIDFKDDNINLLARRNDFTGVDVLLRPAHFRDVDKPFNTGFKLNECTVFSDVGDAARKLRTHWIIGDSGFPRIAFKLLHTKRDTLRIFVDADNLHLNRIADCDDFAWVRNALVADVGYVKQAINSAQINERAVISDILDDAVNHLTFSKR